MISILKNGVLTIVAILSLIIICCNNKIKQKKGNEVVFNRTYESSKSAYEVAIETLNELRNSKTDTIIFYKRTCISCCDFYYIFWASKGKKFIDKFYNDDATHFLRINLSDDKIIKEFSENYDSLKNSSVKENRHTEADGITSGNNLDHYCYVRLIIYSNYDSIHFTATDHDFDKYVEYDFDSGQSKTHNDNYQENVNSKWNALLIIIENQIAALPQTNQREISALRMGERSQ